MHFKADAVSSTARFKCVVMWTPALGRFKRKIMIKTIKAKLTTRRNPLNTGDIKNETKEY